MESTRTGLGHLCSDCLSSSWLSACASEGALRLLGAGAVTVALPRP